MCTMTRPACVWILETTDIRNEFRPWSPAEFYLTEVMALDVLLDNLREGRGLLDPTKVRVARYVREEKP